MGNSSCSEALSSDDSSVEDVSINPSSKAAKKHRRPCCKRFLKCLLLSTRTANEVVNNSMTNSPFDEVINVDICPVTEALPNVQQRRTLPSVEQREVSGLDDSPTDVSSSDAVQWKSSDCYSADYLQYLEKTRNPNASGMGIPKDTCFSLPVDNELNKQLSNEMQAKKKSRRYKTMAKKRKSLPAFQKLEDILNLIGKNQVVVLVGETGCGKTTQVPQYILDSYIIAGIGSTCKIICTQPRRISAIGVAQRVADEQCVPCGEMGPVGYHIRLDKKIPRERGSILFCTTGILLIQLQNNPYLNGISHVIVDEVHERDLLTELLLICLRDIMKINKVLKVILMSATVNSEEISGYFCNCPIIEIPGFTYPVTSYYLEYVLEVTGYNPSKSKSKAREKIPTERTNEFACEDLKDDYLSGLRSLGFSRWVIDILRRWNDEKLNLTLIAELLKFICSDENEGTILVFLPGLQDILDLLREIQEDFPREKYLIIPLHSQTLNFYEKQVLNKAPKGIRKIILSTNIAETSVTIDDCTVVIDSGKVKQQSFDPVTNMNVLQMQCAPMSSVKQRRGRAGRTQPGECYHLFTTLNEILREPFQVPEMKRCSLEQLILNLKILKQCKIGPCLATALSPPSPEAIEVFLQNLRGLNILYPDETLTPLGFLLAKLPVDIQVGKMLLYGAIFSCLDPITSIVACLSFKDPFVPSVETPSKKKASKKKLDLAENDQSDHMMFAYILKAWSEFAWSEFDEEEEEEEANEFCKDYFLSKQTLKMLMDLKTQYTKYLRQLNFIEIANPAHKVYNINSENSLLIKSLICAALYPNLARVYYAMDQPLSGKIKDGSLVHVHPKSVNSFQNSVESDYLTYHMKMKTTKVYVHDTTAVDPKVLLLFENQIEKKKDKRHTSFVVDGWISLPFYTKTRARNILKLRSRLQAILEKKILQPSCTTWNVEHEETKTLRSVVSFITNSPCDSDSDY